MDREQKKRLFKGIGVGLELAGHILNPEKGADVGPEQVEVEDRELAIDFIAVVEGLTGVIKLLHDRIAVLESKVEENTAVTAENNEILIAAFDLEE